jgi:hypothetical protein
LQLAYENDYLLFDLLVEVVAVLVVGLDGLHPGFAIFNLDLLNHQVFHVVINIDDLDFFLVCLQVFAISSTYLCMLLVLAEIVFLNHQVHTRSSVFEGRLEASHNSS